MAWSIGEPRWDRGVYVLVFAVLPLVAGCETPFEARVSSIEIAPLAPLTAIGSTAILVVTARDQRGDALTDVDLGWTSSDVAVVTVTTAGVVHAIANGSATITVSSGTVTASAVVTVAQVVRTLSPTSRIFRSLGDTGSMLAVARDSRGHVIEGLAVTWVSLHPGIATLTNAGFATAVDNGVASVRATAGGYDTTAQIVVMQEIASFSVSPTNLMLELGDSATLTSTIVDARGNQIRNRTITWVSLDSNIASVDSAGVVRFVGRKLDSTRVGVDASGTRRYASVDLRVQFAEIATGSLHSETTCAITTAGVLYCWGDGLHYGQLGIGNNSSLSSTGRALVPVAPASVLRFRRVGISTHGCAVDVDDRAHCWGSGASGELGIDPRANDGTPKPVVGSHAFSSISVELGVTCGVRLDNAALCWGNSYQGSLGNGDPSELDRDAPDLVVGGLAFAAVGTAGSHSCGITVGGTPYCWGARVFGSLGDSSTFMHSDTPVLVAGGLIAESVSVGRGRSCIISTGKDLYCWGWNPSGELATGDSAIRTLPVAVAVGTKFRLVSVGSSHTCALTVADAAMCWGQNSFGQLGNGTKLAAIGPTLVVGGISFVTIRAGGHHTCAISVEGVTYCWGSNSKGQLGTKGPSGTLGNGETVPTVVRGSRVP